MRNHRTIRTRLLRLRKPQGKLNSGSLTIRLVGVPQNSPIQSARPKSGSIKDVERLGAGRGAERIQTLPESALEVIQPHRRSLRRHEARPGRMYGSGDRRHAAIRGSTWSLVGGLRYTGVTSIAFQ